LAEAGRVHAKAVRTGHPIYSFAVIGYRSKEFENIDNESGYSEESPFGLLKRMDRKIAALDVDDQDCMMFYHHVEEVKKVDYRFFKLHTQIGMASRKASPTGCMSEIWSAVCERMSYMGERLVQGRHA